MQLVREQGEKSSKFFLNLEKSRAVQNQIRNILIGNIEVNSQQDINNELYLYYKNLFNERQHLSKTEFLSFLNYLLNNLWNVKNASQKKNYMKL